MYKLLTTNAAGVTRVIELENCITKTVDVCFDDSMATSFETFEFMEINKEYDCKILLFSSIEREDGDLFNYVDDVEILGITLMKVKDEKENEYYVRKENIMNKNKGAYFKINYSRKDLIQVDEMLHPSFKWKMGKFD